jgi:hypothetical protein
METKRITHAERFRLRQEIAAAIRAGQSPSVVCARFGVSYQHVRMACIEHDVQLVRRQNQARDWDYTLSNSVLAKLHRCSRQYVWECRQKFAPAEKRVTAH